MIEYTCCFTGHRQLPLMERDIIADCLKRNMEQLIRENGVRTFLAGGALGFDTLAAHTVLSLKQTYPYLKLGLVLPCREQYRGWQETDKRIYRSILQQADNTIYTGDRYTAGCMHRRNRYLVEHSLYCICYLTHSTGGTFYTVNYAHQQQRRIINIAVPSL